MSAEQIYEIFKKKSRYENVSIKTKTLVKEHYNIMLSKHKSFNKITRINNLSVK